MNCKSYWIKLMFSVLNQIWTSETWLNSKAQYFILDKSTLWHSQCNPMQYQPWFKTSFTHYLPKLRHCFITFLYLHPKWLTFIKGLGSCMSWESNPCPWCCKHHALLFELQVFIKKSFMKVKWVEIYRFTMVFGTKFNFTHFFSTSESYCINWSQLL